MGPKWVAGHQDSREHQPRQTGRREGLGAGDRAFLRQAMVIDELLRRLDGGDHAEAGGSCIPPGASTARRARQEGVRSPRRFPRRPPSAPRFGTPCPSAGTRDVSSGTCDRLAVDSPAGGQHIPVQVSSRAQRRFVRIQESRIGKRIISLSAGSRLSAPMTTFARSRIAARGRCAAFSRQAPRTNEVCSPPRPRPRLGRRCELAGSTGLEPAASGVTGRRSNQLNYDPKLRSRDCRLANCQIGESVRRLQSDQSAKSPIRQFSSMLSGRYRIRTCDSRRVKPVLYH